MDQEVVQLVNSIMHENFEVPLQDLKPTANLKVDLKLDSLDFVDMVVLLEEKVKGQMPKIDFIKIQTLQDVYALVTDLVSENKKK